MHSSENSQTHRTLTILLFPTKQQNNNTTVLFVLPLFTLKIIDMGKAIASSSLTSGVGKKKISVQKRRQENRRLFREITAAFATGMCIDEVNGVNVGAVKAAISRVPGPMELVPLAKDKAALRAKRKMQRQRRRLRGKQERRGAMTELCHPATAVAVAAAIARKKKRAPKKEKKRGGQQ